MGQRYLGRALVECFRALVAVGAPVSTAALEVGFVSNGWHSFDSSPFCVSDAQLLGVGIARAASRNRGGVDAEQIAHLPCVRRLLGHVGCVRAAEST